MLFLHGIIEQIYELLPPPPQEKPKKHMDSSFLSKVNAKKLGDLTLYGNFS